MSMFQAVLCNDTMIKLLIKSGRYGNLNTALTQQRMKESVTVPYSSLSSEQRHVLQEAVSLTNMADPSFSLAVVDVIDTPRREVSDSKYVINPVTYLKVLILLMCVQCVIS